MTLMTTTARPYLYGLGNDQPFDDDHETIEVDPEGFIEDENVCQGKEADTAARGLGNRVHRSTDTQLILKGIAWDDLLAKAKAEKRGQKQFATMGQIKAHAKAAPCRGRPLSQLR